MTLPSQIDVYFNRKRYKRSRHRHYFKWRWIALVAVVAIIGFLFMMIGSEEGELPSVSNSRAVAAKVQVNGLGKANKPVPFAPPARVAPPPARRTVQPPAEVARTKPASDMPQSNPNKAPTKPVIKHPKSLVAPRPATAPSPVAQEISQAIAMMSQSRPVEARKRLNQLLVDGANRITPVQAKMLRHELQQLNADLVFSKRIAAGDPLVGRYVFQSKDILGKVSDSYHIPYQLIEQVNHISHRRIRAGQALKMVKGPFHATIDRSAYRLDVYLRGPNGQPYFIRSFPVGLGEDNSTPVGRWVVRRNGKEANPGWTHPRTGVSYDRDDPTNPIGEYWIGLRGIDDQTRDLPGYGIHGTIEPDSIGKQDSMGCVRMLADDIKSVFAMFTEKKSTVIVFP